MVTLNKTYKYETPCYFLSKQYSKLVVSDKIMVSLDELKQLKATIEKVLKEEDRENIDCSNGHSFEKIGEEIEGYDFMYGGDLKKNVYKCNRCGKIRKGW